MVKITSAKFTGARLNELFSLQHIPTTTNNAAVEKALKEKKKKEAK